MKRLKSALTSLLFAVLFLWLSWGAAGKAYHQARWLWAGHTASGQVIGTTYIHDQYSRSYRMKSHYVIYGYAVDGAAYQGKSLVSFGCYDSCDEGKKITVTYLVDDPTQSEYGGKFYHARWATWYSIETSFWGLMGMCSLVFLFTGFRDAKPSDLARQQSKEK